MLIRKRLIIPLAALLAAAALNGTAAAAAIDTGLTGSITIYSLAVEDAQGQLTAATGEEEEGVEGAPLANLRYTVTLVEDTAVDPLSAQPVEGAGAFRQTVTTDAYGRARLDGLALGLYLIQQEENAAIEQPISDFLVDIPLTSPTGTGRIYNVHVYPKYRISGPPDIHAYVTDSGNLSDSVELGGTARWIVAAQIPADIAAAESFAVQSTPHEYLAFTDGSVSVYAEGTETGRTVLAPDDDYTLTVQNRLLRVTLLEDGIAKASALTSAADAALYVQYETTLNIPDEQLPAALGARIGIDVQLEYTNSLGRPTTSAMQGDGPYVYTGGIGLVKTAAANGRPLEGASFKLYRTRQDALAESGAVQKPGGGDWVETTDAEGIAAFSGLAYGGKGISNTAGTSEYFLVQTRAPEGYNLLRTPLAVTVDAASHLEENEVAIQGRTGFLLPATGGMGTVWFTVIGGLLIGLALYLYLHTRRKRPKNGRST